MSPLFSIWLRRSLPAGWLALGLLACGSPTAAPPQNPHADEPARSTEKGSRETDGHDDHASHDDAEEPAEAKSHDDHARHDESKGHDDHADHAGHEGHGENLALGELRGITFAAVQPPRRESAFVAAEAFADEQATSLVPAPIGGQVLRVNVLPGREVRAGEVLFELHSPTLVQLRRDLLVARAELARARADREREERLLAAGATARRDVEAAQAAEAVALAEEQAALFALAARGLPSEGQDARILVPAPRAGKVTELHVRRGETVEEAAPLLTLLSGKAALVRLELPLPGPTNWPAGSLTEARLGDGRRWPARLEGEPASISADSRRLLFRLRLEGEDLPLPGTPVEVRVPLDWGYVLPQNALQQIEGEWGVFRRQGESATFVPVRRGAELGRDVLVLAGLAEGDQVATEGAYLLKALWLKRAGGGGDAHDH